MRKELVMKGKFTGLPFVVASILTALALVSAAAAEGVVQTATGSGHFEFTSDTGVMGLRTFAFEARKAGDGSVTGQADVYNRAVEQRFHIRIDCLNVFGNVAVMSGTISHAAGPGVAVGDTAIFAVQDNGEGAGASSDRVTRVFFNTGLVCTAITPATADYSLLISIAGGNVQIR
jgi:hypothetical protein